jgi:YcxB-like protein
MLQLEYQLTEQEFLDYYFYTCWQIPEKKSTRIRYYTGIPVIFLVVMTAFLYLMDHGELQIFSIAILGVGFLFLIFMTRYRIRSVFDKQAKRMIEQSGLDTILKKTELTLDENGIFVKTKVAEAKYSWNAFKKKMQINNCYYLYTNVGQAIVIPLRAIASPNEKEEFEEILLAYFPLQVELDSLTK